MSENNQKSLKSGSEKTFVPGVTILSLSTMFLGLIVIGFMIQVGNIHAGASFMIGGLFALPLRPVMFLVPLILLSGLVFHLKKKSIYTQAELVCILGALLVAPPLMTEGFWTYALGGMATIPQTSDMAKLDAFSDKMWPHGENKIAGVFEQDSSHGRSEVQGTVKWEDLEVDAGTATTVPVLYNDSPNATSFIRIPVQILDKEGGGVYIDEPYLLTTLVRAVDLGSDSFYYCRIFNDLSDSFTTEVFSSRETASVSFLRPGGFIRKGRYGIEFSPELEKQPISNLV